MPRAKKISAIATTTEAPESAPVVTDQTDVNAIDSTEPNAAIIDIYDDAERFVRQYSRVVHGDNYEQLAESFLAGHPNCHKA